MFSGCKNKSITEVHLFLGYKQHLSTWKLFPPFVGYFCCHFWLLFLSQNKTNKLTFSQCYRWIRIFARSWSTNMVHSTNLETVNCVGLQMFNCIRSDRRIGVDFLFQIMKVGIVVFFNLAPTGKENFVKSKIHFEKCLFFNDWSS